MRILVAPQEFKGTLTATAAAEAISRGCRRALPGAEIDFLPFSDGGPGFIDALAPAVPSRRVPVTVQDAIGRPADAELLVLDEGRAIAIEAAQSNGLARLLPTGLDPLHADTFGVGELIARALDLRPRQVTVGVGGSATTDGGAGMARALGARFLDGAGRDLPRGGAPLADLVRIDWHGLPSAAGVQFVVATDVTSLLTGPTGAARVFSPQKGASTEQVDHLETALVRYAVVLRHSLGADVADLPGAGAAGGLAAGLVAFLGAHIVSGFDVVADATGLIDRLRMANLVVTGEGSFDDQSSRGKVTGRLIAMAQQAGKSLIVLAGRAAVTGANVHSLAEVEPDTAKQMENAAPLLEELAWRVAATLAALPPPS